MVRVVRRTMPYTIIITFIAFSAYVLFGMQSKLFTSVNGLWIFTRKEYFLNISRTFGLISNSFNLVIPQFSFSDIIVGLKSIVNALILIINIGFIGFRGFIVIGICMLSIYGMPIEAGYPVFDFLSTLNSVQIPYI